MTVRRDDQHIFEFKSDIIPASYCMKTTCDVAVWLACLSATVAQLKSESSGGTSLLYTLIAFQHTGLATYSPDKPILLENSEVYTLHHLTYKVRHRSVSGLTQTEVHQQNIHFIFVFGVLYDCQDTI